MAEGSSLREPSLNVGPHVGQRRTGPSCYSHSADAASVCQGSPGRGGKSPLSPLLLAGDRDAGRYRYCLLCCQLHLPQLKSKRCEKQWKVEVFS